MTKPTPKPALLAAGTLLCALALLPLPGATAATACQNLPVSTPAGLPASLALAATACASGDVTTCGDLAAEPPVPLSASPQAAACANTGAGSDGALGPHACLAATAPLTRQQACLASPCGSFANPFSADLGTGETQGTPLPPNQPDPRWRIGVNPAGGKPGPAITAAPYPGWLTPTDASWISTLQSTALGVAPTGSYHYEVSFVLPANAYNAHISLEAAADNGADLYLNGALVGSFHTGTYHDFGEWHAFSLSGPFAAGANTLTAVVNNFSGPTGLVVHGHATACVPTCLAVSSIYDVGTGEAWGTPLPANSPDPRWQIGANAAGAAPGPAVAVAPYPGWLPPTDASWVSATQATGTGAAIGDYTYQVSFTLPIGATNLALSFEAAADNGVQFSLNGVALGGFHDGTAQDFGTWHAFSYTGPALVAGANTLTAVVTNDDGPTGLLVHGGATADHCVLGPA